MFIFKIGAKVEFFVSRERSDHPEGANKKGDLGANFENEHFNFEVELRFMKEYLKNRCGGVKSLDMRVYMINGRLLPYYSVKQ